MPHLQISAVVMNYIKYYSSSLHCPLSLFYIVFSVFSHHSPDFFATAVLLCSPSICFILFLESFPLIALAFLLQFYVVTYTLAPSDPSCLCIYIHVVQTTGTISARLQK